MIKYLALAARPMSRMRKLVIAFLVAGLGLLAVAPAAKVEAGGRRFVGGPRVFVGVGVWPGFWGPWWPYYPPPPVYAFPPVVVQQSPTVFVEQQQPAPIPPVPAPPPQVSQEVFWYYCPSGHDYYPKVQVCPEEWVKVPPRPH